MNLKEDLYFACNKVQRVDPKIFKFSTQEIYDEFREINNFDFLPDSTENLLSEPSQVIYYKLTESIKNPCILFISNDLEKLKQTLIGVSCAVDAILSQIHNSRNIVFNN